VLNQSLEQQVAHSELVDREDVTARAHHFEYCQTGVLITKVEPKPQALPRSPPQSIGAYGDAVTPFAQLNLSCVSASATKRNDPKTNT